MKPGSSGNGIDRRRARLGIVGTEFSRGKRENVLHCFAKSVARDTQRLIRRVRCFALRFVVLALVEDTTMAVSGYDRRRSDQAKLEPPCARHPARPRGCLRY